MLIHVIVYGLKLMLQLVIKKCGGHGSGVES